jgi:MFS transporter, SET family, sugar efflux transporter
MTPWISSARVLLRQPNFIGILASTFALGVAFSFVAPFMSVWATTSAGFTPRQFSWFMTAVTLSAIVNSTWLARLSDTRLSRRTLLLIGSTAGVAGYLGYAFLSARGSLLVAGVCLVAIASVCFSQLFAHVREVYAASAGDESSTWILSVVRACFSVSWTAGPAVAAAVMVHFGFRGLFLAAAFLYALFCCGIYLYIPHIAPGHHSSASASAKREPIWRALSRLDLLACFVAFVSVFGAHAMNMMNLPLLITKGLNGTPTQLGITFCIGPIVEIPLMLWFGYLGARGARFRLILLGVLATALYFVAVSFARLPWHIYPIQILSGLSFAIITNVAISFFQDLLPGQMGLATTIYANSANTGNLTGYFLFGSLLESYGHRGVAWACAGASVASFLLLCTYPALRKGVRE